MDTQTNNIHTSTELCTFITSSCDGDKDESINIRRQLERPKLVQKRMRPNLEENNEKVQFSTWKNNNNSSNSNTGNKYSFSAWRRKCCMACAWREEQMSQMQKKQRQSTNCTFSLVSKILLFVSVFVLTLIASTKNSLVAAAGSFPTMESPALSCSSASYPSDRDITQRAFNFFSYIEDLCMHRHPIMFSISLLLFSILFILATNNPTIERAELLSVDKVTKLRQKYFPHEEDMNKVKHNSSKEASMNQVSPEMNSREERYARILSEAIRCETVSYDQEELERQPQLLVEYHVELKKLHELLKSSFPILHSRYPPVIIAEYSLLYKIPGGGFNDDDGSIKGKPILLCSHMDVVPAPSNAEWGQVWKHDPFGGEIVDGFVWGRGAIDNKHNMVGQLAAVENILSNASSRMNPSTNSFNRTVYIAIGHDEEIGGIDGAANIAKYLREEENITEFEYILDEGTMMVSGAIPGLKCPLAMIGTVEKGFMTVELTVEGKGGHASMPPIRDNSNRSSSTTDNTSLMKIMSQAILALEHSPMPAHFEKGSSFRNMLEYISHLLSFPLNIICSNFWLFGPLMKQILLRASNGAAAGIRTTTAVTKIYGGSKVNVLPFEVKAFVNHRVHPLDSLETVLEHDKKVVNDSRVKMQVMDGSRRVSPDSGHVSSGFSIIQHCVQVVFGYPAAPMLVIGNTDTCWYWDFSKQIYRFSPVTLTISETAMFHGLNERISTRALADIVIFYELLLKMSDDSIS